MSYPEETYYICHGAFSAESMDVSQRVCNNIYSSVRCLYPTETLHEQTYSLWHGASRAASVDVSRASDVSWRVQQAAAASDAGTGRSIGGG
jgi:hypothetical protein